MRLGLSAEEFSDEFFRARWNRSLLTVTERPITPLPTGDWAKKRAPVREPAFHSLRHETALENSIQYEVNCVWCSCCRGAVLRPGEHVARFHRRDLRHRRERGRRGRTNTARLLDRRAVPQHVAAQIDTIRIVGARHAG